MSGFRDVQGLGFSPTLGPAHLKVYVEKPSPGEESPKPTVLRVLPLGFRV